MDVLNWNIRSGGGKRIEKIVAAVIAYSPDVVVITEYRKGKSGEYLKNALGNSGFQHFSVAPCESNKNTSLIAVKRFARQSDLSVPAHLAPYITTAFVSGFNIIAAFCANEQVGRAFLSFLSEISKEKELQALATGDFFFGPRGSNPNYGSRVTEALAPNWVDLYNDKNEKKVWSFNNGRGGVSRPDQAWVTSNIRTVFSEAYFDPDPLEMGLSDHAPLLFSFYDSVVTKED